MFSAKVGMDSQQKLLALELMAASLGFLDSPERKRKKVWCPQCGKESQRVGKCNSCRETK